MTRPYSDDEIRDMLTWAKAFPEKPEAQAILRWGATVTHWKANHADAVEKKRRGEEVKQGIIDEVQRENDELRAKLKAIEAREAHDVAYTESLRARTEELRGGRDHDTLVIADMARKVDRLRGLVGSLLDGIDCGGFTLKERVESAQRVLAELDG